jgi:hypothetical protein
VAEGHFAQIALALPEFERQFGHRMFRTAMSLAQKWFAQFGPPGLEAFLAVAHRSQRVIDNALALGFRGVDDALCAGFGLKQAFEMIFHLPPRPRPGILTPVMQHGRRPVMLRRDRTRRRTKSISIFCYNYSPRG